MLENFLSYANGGSLVLYDYEGIALGVEDYAVAASLFAVGSKLHFVSHEGWRVALVVGEESGELLAHPFFGSESYVTAAKEVVNSGLALALAYFYVGNWQV